MSKSTFLNTLELYKRHTLFFSTLFSSFRALPSSRAQKVHRGLNAVLFGLFSDLCAKRKKHLIYYNDSI